MTRFSDSQPVRSVLIIEDTDADATILQTQLARFSSATILSVRDISLDAAIKRLARTRFDVVIADLNLPGSTPAEVMERLPTACRTAALIVVSAMTQDLLAAAMDAKIEGVLPKTEHAAHETLETQIIQAVTRKQSAVQRRTRMKELEDRVDHQDDEIRELKDTQAKELRAIKAANAAQVAEFKAQIARLEGQAEGRAAGVEMSKGMLAALFAGVAVVAGAIATAVVSNM